MDNLLVILFSATLSAAVAFATAHLRFRYEEENWRRNLAERFAIEAGDDEDARERFSAQFAIGLLYFEKNGGMQKYKKFLPIGCRYLVGRENFCDLKFESNDLYVSRIHAVLTANRTKVKITDLNSLHGVIVNGNKIKGHRTLRHGDKIEIGGNEIIFFSLV